jgi:hypothetical protein
MLPRSRALPGMAETMPKCTHSLRSAPLRRNAVTPYAASRFNLEHRSTRCRPSSPTNTAQTVSTSSTDNTSPPKRLCDASRRCSCSSPKLTAQSPTPRNVKHRRNDPSNLRPPSFHISRSCCFQTKSLDTELSPRRNESCVKRLQIFPRLAETKRIETLARFVSNGRNRQKLRSGSAPAITKRPKPTNDNELIEMAPRTLSPTGVSSTRESATRPPVV